MPDLHTHTSFTTERQEWPLGQFLLVAGKQRSSAEVPPVSAPGPADSCLLTGPTPDREEGGVEDWLQEVCFCFTLTQLLLKMQTKAVQMSCRCH